MPRKREILDEQIHRLEAQIARERTAQNEHERVIAVLNGELAIRKAARNRLENPSVNSKSNHQSEEV